MSRHSPDERARAQQGIVVPRPPSIVERYSDRLRRAELEVERLRKLISLLNTSPDAEKILELMEQIPPS
jgi:hypothetical protein